MAEPLASAQVQCEHQRVLVADSRMPRPVLGGGVAPVGWPTNEFLELNQENETFRTIFVFMLYYSRPWRLNFG